MDVTLNEDKLCRQVPEYNTDMWVPGTLKREVVAGSVEPVSVAEAKTYLKINFSNDDSVITRKIAEARVWCENLICQSLVSTDVQVTVQVATFVELPYGPVEDTDTIDGVDQKFIGKGTFPTIYGTVGRFDIKYRAGYQNAPEWVKDAILARVAATYENRGDQDKTNYSQVARSILAPHKRVSAWL